MSSDVVGDLDAGTRVELGAKAFVGETARVEITAPLRGFVSQRCVREESAPDDGARPPRLFAISDLHADYEANFAWLSKTFSTGAFRGDGLIVAGDIAASTAVLQKTLALCVSSFAQTSFVVGNHDLWSDRGSGDDSLAKLAKIDRLCAELGVATRPALVAGCVVAPIASWHHAAWDTEPEVTGWEKIPDHTRCMSDFYRCAFPGLDQETDDVARHFDGLNGALEAEVAALRAAHPAAPLVTFSHFVPRLELVPEKRFLYLPTLNKAVGSAFLQRRVDALRPDCHVFGHTHFGWDATVDGVRYLQGCLAYPTERERRLSTVCASDFPHASDGPLLVHDGASGFPPTYTCGWSGFYAHHPRNPAVTHVLPDYVASAYERVPGVGVVGWGDGVKPAWMYGPLSSRIHRSVA